MWVLWDIRRQSLFLLMKISRLDLKWIFSSNIYFEFNLSTYFEDAIVWFNLHFSSLKLFCFWLMFNTFWDSLYSIVWAMPLKLAMGCWLKWMSTGRSWRRKRSPYLKSWGATRTGRRWVSISVTKNSWHVLDFFYIWKDFEILICFYYLSYRIKLWLLWQLRTRKGCMLLLRSILGMYCIQLFPLQSKFTKG